MEEIKLGRKQLEIDGKDSNFVGGGVSPGRGHPGVCKHEPRRGVHACARETRRAGSPGKLKAYRIRFIAY
jgi:hypothetical protein